MDGELLIGAHQQDIVIEKATLHLFHRFASQDLIQCPALS